MTAQAIILFIFTLVNFSAGNKCYQKGKTWAIENQLNIVENVNLKQCAAVWNTWNQEYHSGGFTWYQHNQKAHGVK